MCLQVRVHWDSLCGYVLYLNVSLEPGYQVQRMEFISKPGPNDSLRTTDDIGKSNYK
jgi:hypothetical protein